MGAVTIDCRYHVNIVWRNDWSLTVRCGHCGTVYHSQDNPVFPESEAQRVRLIYEETHVGDCPGCRTCGARP